MKKLWLGGPLFNVPNVFSFVGIAGVLLYVYLYLSERDHLLFFAVAFVGATDFFDGYFARKLNQSSKFGAILDISRDRMLLLAFFGNIAWRFGPGTLLGFISAIITCEVIFNILRIFFLKRGLIDTVRRKYVGKSRQVVHLLFLCLLTMSFGNLWPLSQIQHNELAFLVFSSKIMFFFSLSSLLYFIGSIICQWKKSAK